MRKIVGILSVLFLISVLTIGNTYANNSIPITAEQTFDAYANQEDPTTGMPANVAIIDVRTPAEYSWVGSCAQVEKIIKMNEEEIIPYNGKVQLSGKTGLLKFKIVKRGILLPGFLHISNVKKIETTPISKNIPYFTWDNKTCGKVGNENFVSEMEALASEGVDVIIMMCRSGKRSSIAEFDFSLFQGVYEMDQPDGQNGRGGFQGSNYDDKYNGYRGYPGRKTFYQEHESVSWSAAGLPVHIGWCPVD